MRVRSAILLGAAALSAAPLWAGTSAGPAQLSKKLIQYGWGIPKPDDIREHVREMEKRPFDGLIFQLSGGRNVLQPTAWPEERFTTDFENCKAIEWDRFTDNFVIMLAASDQDWFNDEHWQAIEHNVRLLAKGARLARCKGICFDAEPYGGNPWAYSRAAHRQAKSFAEYEQMVRRRGGQFIRAVESELSGATIMTFFLLSYFDTVLVSMDPTRRAETISALHYAFLPAFLNGMLEAASPDVRFVDGNERAYYYTSAEPYFRNYQTVTQRGLLLVDPALWPKYREQVQVGNALYVDQYFGLRTREVLGHYLTPEERPQWFEHNVYWALFTSDRYVWCYSERMHWFRNENVPPGSEAAIRSAQAQLAAGAGVSLDITALVDAGAARRLVAIQQRLKPRTAEIRRLAADGAAPTIDGSLDDAGWSGIAPLEPLVPLAEHPQTLKAQTRAWVTYDQQKLYVGVRCEEPLPDRMTIVGTTHDDPVWEGEDVEVMVAAPGASAPFCHFMLNPRGAHWDGYQAATNDLSYNPVWAHAVKCGDKEWTAEFAVPWGALKMSAPAPGSSLRANICRQRRHARELSAWSPMATGFLEHELFGTWVFK